jgi:flavin-dependent dehydrogenase
MRRHIYGKKYDVIVVGAGLAGFLAAKAAGENGLKVALLERNPDPARRTRTCGETLVSMREYWLGNICGYNSRDRRVFFSSDGFSFKYDGPYQNIYAVQFYTPSGHKVAAGDPEAQRKKGDYGRVGLAFDKEAMFRCLLEDVRACSVDVFPGIDVQKVTSTAEGAIVEGGGQAFEGAYVIAADGANSRVAHRIEANTRTVRTV